MRSLSKIQVAGIPSSRLILCAPNPPQEKHFAKPFQPTPCKGPMQAETTRNLPHPWVQGKLKGKFVKTAPREQARGHHHLVLLSTEHQPALARPKEKQRQMLTPPPSPTPPLLPGATRTGGKFSVHVQFSLTSSGALGEKGSSFLPMHNRAVRKSVSQAPRIPSPGTAAFLTERSSILHRIYYSVTGGRERKETG